MERARHAEGLLFSSNVGMTNHPTYVVKDSSITFNIFLLMYESLIYYVMETDKFPLTCRTKARLRCANN